jgi:RHS repeat-associated protein
MMPLAQAALSRRLRSRNRRRVRRLASGRLHYNYFRDYDPQTGRYVESDPLGLDGGLGTYTYVGDNPIAYVDPRGLTAFLLFNLPKTDDCKLSEWKHCETYCAPRAVKGCYVSLSWKWKSLGVNGPIRSEQRTVNCNCDDGCRNSFKLNPSWLLPLLPLLPFLAAAL